MATTSNIKFKIGKSGQFIVVYLDNKGNREIVDLKPRSYVQFEINSSVPYREFFMGSSNYRGFSCPVNESDDSLFERLLMAFNEWLKNLGMSVEFDTARFRMKIVDNRFFGFDRDRREILYVDLSEVISAKDGVVRFSGGSSITPCRKFYDTIQEELYLSDDLKTF